MSEHLRICRLTALALPMLRFCFSIRLPLLPLTSAILGFYQRSYVSAPSLPALRRGAHGSTFFGLCLDLAPSQSAVADFQYLLVSSSRSPSFVVHAVYKTFAGSAVPRALFLFTQPITPFLLNSKLTQGASTLDRGPPVSDSIYETTIFLSAAFCGADCKTMPWNPKALAKHFASGEDSGSLSTPDLPKKMRSGCTSSTTAALAYRLVTILFLSTAFEDLASRLSQLAGFSG
jgi:hypothetical protein